jgi:hypothetical protein
MKLNPDSIRPIWDTKISSTIGKGKVWNVANDRVSLLMQRKRTKLALANTLSAKSIKTKDLINALNNVDDGEVEVNYLYEKGDKKPDFIQVNAYAGGTEFGKVFKMDGTTVVMDLSDGEITDCTTFAHKDTEIHVTTHDESGNEKVSYGQENAYELIPLSHDLNYGDIGLRKICYTGTASGVNNILFKMMKDSNLIAKYGKLKRSFDENGNRLNTNLNMMEGMGIVDIDFEYEFADELEINFNFSIEPCD